ncbi:MAG: hypothetical protein MMC23_008322 [Stictis urceolatum]|nr:hypothetical protein [Stictis urceolata]
MVLEDSVSPAAGDYFSSDPSDPSNPQSDLQAALYQQSYKVTGPKPLPIFGPMFGFTGARFERMFRQQIAVAASLMNRVPTQEEAQALAYHTGKELKIASLGGPLGVVAGLWRANRTKESWRLPFWKMSEDFNPEVVKFGQRTFLEGERAKVFWRSLRGTLYSANGATVGLILFLSYASAVGVVGMRQDPRLKEYTNAIVQKIEETRNDARLRQRERLGQIPQQGDKGLANNGAENNANTYGDVGQEKSSSGWDDASPSGGGFGEQTIQMNPDTDRQNSPSSAGERSSAWNRTTAQARPPPQQQQESQPAGGFYDDYDNASPTAQAPASSASASGGGGSWDRIRRGQSSAPQQNTSQQKPQQQSSGSNDGYTYSSSDAQRQWAQGEAQKEFDERVERERRGGDFEGKGRDGRY